MLALFFSGHLWAAVDHVALAARLTAWEAAYRGLRLPRRVGATRTALSFGALPAGGAAGVSDRRRHQVLIYIDPSIDRIGMRYLYVLCGEVILGAAICQHLLDGMRNLMYANG